MSPAAWVLVATAVLVAAIGATLRLRSGRVRPAPRTSATAGATGPPRPPRLPDEVLTLLPAHDGVTLLQLSTTFCAPCRHTRALLGDLVERTPGLRHVEVDLTLRPELVEPLRVRSTPTTIAVDAAGHELLRLVGVPRRDALVAALGPHLPHPSA